MNKLQTKTSVLDGPSVKRKLVRMALEIAERNIDEGPIVLAGINGNGVAVAERLAEELKKVHPFTIEVVTILMNKKTPDEVSILPVITLAEKVVVIVDDVANTGQTIFYALKPFLASKPKSLQTAVLVERSHKLFPIQTDYAGMSIATTLQEHIAVETEGDNILGAWLY